MNKSLSNIKRMEIYVADLPLSGGSVQMGKRPVLIVQNDVCNLKSPNVIVVPITSKEKRWDWLHVELPTSTGIEKESYALCEQILTISKECLIKKIGELKDPELIRAVDQALQITLFFERGRKTK
jgi:mRNA interferase MazF